MTLPVQTASVRASGSLRRLLRELLRSPKRSVSSRLFLLFFCFIVGSAGIVGGVSYSLSKSMITNQALASSQHTIAQAADKLDMKLSFFSDIGNQLLSNAVFQENLLQLSNAGLSAYERSAREEEIRKMLDQAALTGKQIRDITLFYADSRDAPISTDRGSLTPADGSLWQEPILQAGGREVWLPARDKGYLGTSPKPLFAFGLLLGSENYGLPRDFVLLIQVDAAALQDILANVTISPRSDVFLAASDRKTVIAYSSAESAATPPAADLEQAGGADKFVYRNAAGEDMLLSAYPSERSGWLLVGRAPVRELTRETDRIAYATLIIVAVNIAAAVAAGLLVARMVGSPLIDLQALMLRGADGDLSGRTVVRSKDEIGRVGESYNRMMEQIGALLRRTQQSTEQVAASSSRLQSVSAQTTQSAEEIARASEQIASGAVALAADAEQGAVFVARMNDSATAVLGRNRTMGDAAAAVGEICSEGGRFVEQLLGKSSATEASMQRMNARVVRLQESAASVQEVMRMLTHIAQQTNILSINAAIEASRAGSAGKGFLVVADEIRRLADQSRQSIMAVDELTTSIREEIGATTEALNDAFPFFRELMADVRRMDEIFGQVRSQMDAFSQGVSETAESLGEFEETQSMLFRAMENVSAVSQQSSASTEQVAALCGRQLEFCEGLVELSRQLETVSRSLQEGMERFVVGDAAKPEVQACADS